jgi:hypothetical protein
MVENGDNANCVIRKLWDPKWFSSLAYFVMRKECKTDEMGAEQLEYQWTTSETYT